MQHVCASRYIWIDDDYQHTLIVLQEWGAECSSALFELPHFAVELLIVLPTVQIICSRLRILALPQLRVVVSCVQLRGTVQCLVVNSHVPLHIPSTDHD